MTVAPLELWGLGTFKKKKGMWGIWCLGELKCMQTPMDAAFLRPHHLFHLKVWEYWTMLHKARHLVTQQTSSYNWRIILISWLNDRVKTKTGFFKISRMLACMHAGTQIHAHTHTHIHTRTHEHVHRHISWETQLKKKMRKEKREEKRKI